MKSLITTATALLLAAMTATLTAARPRGDENDSGERRGHRVATIFVDWQAPANGDGSPTAPYQTIAQAMERAREIRKEKRSRIIVRVAPGDYVQDSPIYLDVSNLELRGSTRLVEDDDGLPQNCGSDTAPTPCLLPGTETVIAPARPLANAQVILFVAPTTDTPTQGLTNITVRGFLFDGRATNVATSGVAIFVDRVENFFVRDNVTRRVLIGVFTRLASGRIKGHFAYESNDGLAIAGGSRIYPANVEVRANRLIGNLEQGVVALGTANSRSVIQDPHLIPVQTVFDPAGHPEQVPNRLTLAVVGNDISSSPRFGMRLENYISGNGFYDTTNNQPMTSHITAKIQGNSFRDNGEYGVTVEGAFATRTNPRMFTGTFAGLFEDNDLTGNGRAGMFVGFMLNGVVTRNPGLINQYKYLQDSRFTVRTDEEADLFGVDYDNPILDRFDGTTPLNNALVIDPRINLQLDPETRTPRTDEYSIGVDRELGRRVAVAVAYVRKDGSNFIAWTDVGGRYREETRTLSDGRSVPVFALANSRADRRFLLTNPDGYSLTYNGLVMAVEKRPSRGWQAFASYTFSKVEGFQPAGTTAAPAQISSIVGSANFGRDPNDLTNARGRLPNDRPHTFRAMGTVEVPRTGTVFAANLQYFSGRPWAATAQITLPQGTQRILLEPRGSRRLSSQSLLDLRVSRAIVSSGLGRIELLLDVLNALNDTSEESLATDNLFSPNFGQPNVFLDPRRAMIGVRLNLGR